MRTIEAVIYVDRFSGISRAIPGATTPLRNSQTSLHDEGTAVVSRRATHTVPLFIAPLSFERPSNTGDQRWGHAANATARGARH
jgi:hypothetical protein